MSSDAATSLLAVKAMASITVDSCATNALIRHTDLGTNAESTGYLEGRVLHLQSKGCNWDCVDPS